MSDLISRQAAISAICSACGKIDCDKMDKCEKLQLPPANSSEFPNNSDTISRQQAIDALRNYLVGKNVPCDGTLTCRLIENEVISKLPSAQPEPLKIDLSGYSEEDWERLKKEWGNTPITVLSAQPKRGRWISADAMFHGVPFYCSECGENTRDTVMGKPRWKFCPMCGSYNGGENDE